MTVPPEVQAMHLRQFDAYISALIQRLPQTGEYDFVNLCERIERLLSIDRQFYEDREEPRVVETPPIISPPAEQAPSVTEQTPALDETRRRVTEEDRNRCRERDQDGNRCLHDEGHQGRHLAAWGLSAGWPDATPEQPEEEPTDERHDEPLRVSLHEVPSEMRGGADSRVDGARDSRIDEEPLLQRASNGGSGQQPEPVAEEPVRAEPTMSPEELARWQSRVNAGDNPQTVEQTRRTRTWTPEQRAAQAARMAKLREEGKQIGRPAKAAQSLTKEPENAALLDTPIELSEEPETTLIPFTGNGITVDPTPEEAAHEDAALIIAELEPPKPPSLPRGGRTTDAPACECPEGHLKPTELWMALDRAYTHRHAASCPLHRHRHRFGNAPDAEGRLVGRCECGDEEYRPVEPERSLNKKPAAVSA